MKKILLVMPYFYPHKGGSQKYAEELYTTLIKKYPHQFTVDVLAYNTDNAQLKETYRGMTIHRIPCFQLIGDRFALPNPFSLITKLKELSKNKYDFVNVHLIFFDPAWWAWIFAKIINAKSILTEHVASYPVHQSKIIEKTAKLVDKTIGKLALNKYDIITVTNKAAEKFLRKELGLKKKANIIYGGVDTKYFSQSKNKNFKLNQTRFTNKDILVTFVGRLIWTKGVTYLYEAIKEIDKISPENVRFIIAGGGELEEQIKKQIKKDKLAKRVFMTGFIDYKKVKDLLSHTDIFINPSHHNEGFPNTILEAGASNCFVIATDNAGSKEVVENKKTGLLIKQKNKEEIKQSLLWAISHTKERQKFSHNLNQLLKKDFDWQIIADQYKKLLS